MSFGAVFILAVGLAMDAFAVAVCKGLALKKISAGKAALVGVWFGGFQALMPLIGYLLGTGFEDRITAIDHWIAFILLGLIGFNMIREACSGEEEEEEADDRMDVKSMLLLAIATSIDALAVGITFAFLKVNIVMAVSTIGVVTLIISAAGVYIGHIFGAKYKAKAELAGGVILILIGLRILLEHLGIF